MILLFSLEINSINGFIISKKMILLTITLLIQTEEDVLYLLLLIEILLASHWLIILFIHRNLAQKVKITKVLKTSYIFPNY